MEKTIQQITEELLHQRERVNEMTEALRTEKAKKDEMQARVMAELNKQGFNSVKIGNTNVSKATRKTMQIVDEKELMKDLRDKGLNDYISEQVDKNLFKGLATKMAKEDKTFEGTEIKESEFISIRVNKSKK